MGCKFEAFLAGYQPNRIPIPTETKKARKTDVEEIVKIEELTRE